MDRKAGTVLHVVHYLHTGTAEIEVSIVCIITRFTGVLTFSEAPTFNVLAGIHIFFLVIHNNI